MTFDIQGEADAEATGHVTVLGQPRVMQRLADFFILGGSEAWSIQLHCHAPIVSYYTTRAYRVLISYRTSPQYHP